MYLSFNDPVASPGVFRKEREFCKLLGEAGRERGIDCKGLCIVTYAGVGRKSQIYGDHYELRKVPSFLYKMFSRVPLLCSIFRIRPTFSEAYREIALYKPDAVIWRFSITAVPGIFNPKTVCPEVCFISEHQSKEIEELRMTTAGRIAAPIIQRHRDRVLKTIDAVIGVTDEITRYELACVKRSIPSYTMTNGIDVRLYPVKKTDLMAGDRLRLLYVGSHTAHWQGFDRVLRGIAAYRGDIKIELHIAGNVDTSTRKIIDALDIGHNIHAHGYVEGNALDRLFDDCDIAVGTLGIHRKNLVYGSTLKVREYMARGIPFMLSYTDEDLSPDLPYVFKARSDDSPIDMSEVLLFIRQLHQRYGKSLSTQMHTYALEHMDYKAKITRLLDFITSQRLHH